MNRRVAITGMGVVSPLGDTLAASLASLREGRHGIVQMPEWDHIKNLDTRLGAPAKIDLSVLVRRFASHLGVAE